MKLGTAYSALALISALALTGCGADDDTAPSASDAPTSNSSTSTSTSSAQAKAGEYQPATENGPAQNVPRPQKPEGMDVESVEGLEKFLNYWFEMRDYAIKTGDTTELFKRVETSYKTDLNLYDALSNRYKQGSWLAYTNGEPKLVLYSDSVTTADKGELFAIPANITLPDAKVYDSSGKVVEEITGQSSKQKYDIVARFENGKWSLVAIEVQE